MTEAEAYPPVPVDDPAIIASLMRGVKCVLLDFDGPVCDVFAGFSAPAVARSIWSRLGKDVLLPGTAQSIDDPLDLLKIAASHSPQGQARVEELLEEAELECARLASPTSGAREFLEQCATQSRSVVIVSNNCEPAIRAYLAREGLEPLVLDVAGRDSSDASLMKPNPFLLREGMNRAKCWPGDAIMIGDSVSDVIAAQRAGVPAIGLANKPGKDHRLVEASADAVVRTMSQLYLVP